MKASFGNKTLSSLLLWFDHTLCDKGQAYTNVGSLFYKTANYYTGLQTYTAPYKGFVADSSVSGANILSGVYLNNIYTPLGTSGFTGCNYELGQIYFTGLLPSNIPVSGNYALKEFNVRLTSISEEKLLFETKYSLRNKTPQIPTGIQPENITYPVIYLKRENSHSEPFAFGGLDKTHQKVTAIVLAASQFSADAVCSLFEDRVRTYVPLIEQSEMPYNAFGGLNSGVYNYTGQVAAKPNSSQMFIDSAASMSIQGSAHRDLYDLNPGVFVSVIELDTIAIRDPRL